MNFIYHNQEIKNYSNRFRTAYFNHFLFNNLNDKQELIFSRIA